MATHITEDKPTAPASTSEKQVAAPRDLSLVGASRGNGNSRPVLIGLAVLVNLGIVALGYFLFTQKKVSPPEERKIAVAFADQKPILDLWRQAPVQHGGRIKPLDSLATDTVRHITGRSRFEKNDPVAVLLSWMMTYQQKEGEISETDYAATIARGKELGADWENYPFLLCDYHALRQLLYEENKDYPTVQSDEEKKHGKYVEPALVRQSMALKKIYDTITKEKKGGKVAPLTPLELKAQELYGRWNRFETIRKTGNVGMVYLLKGDADPWFSIYNLRGFLDPSLLDRSEGSGWAETLDDRSKHHPQIDRKQPFPQEQVEKILAKWNAAQAAYLTKDTDRFQAASKDFLETRNSVSQNYNPSFPATGTAELELSFNKLNPFRWAWIVSLLGSLLLGFRVMAGSESKAGKLLYLSGLGAYCVGLAFAIYGFYCRVTISGRPPVSNMYESIIWVAFMTAVFGLILELVYRRGVIALAGGLVSTLGFLLADQLPTVFSPTIEPLVAVLRSNYWLIIHVLTIVTSYAALALAWGLGNINIALIVYAPHRKPLIQTLSNYSYRAIQIGVLLLFLGTMLGGFWADESWGRFWGWDPKEVWALIAFMVYIIPLHARFIGWVKDFGLAACSVICFSAVVMAWYGVNYVLGAGLHSYGFGSGNNMWVAWMALINISLVVHAGIRYIGRGQHLKTE